MNFGLDSITIHRINSVFATFPEIEEAVIFGSRAKGNFKNGSDIDLSLKGADLSTSKLLRINHQLDDLSLPYTIDLNIYHLINDEELINHIERVGTVFYKS
jgi:predicted nucleotidyltransferase